MSEPKFGCLVCGKDLVYLDKIQKQSCMYCKSEFEAEVMCTAGHYICDDCHSMDANDIIESYCLNSDSTEPLEMALHLMRHPKVKMHGPEHHFLVPAVLISAYYNHKSSVKISGERENEMRKTSGSDASGDDPKNIKRKMLKKARGRAQNVPGGFCGFYGDCGAAVGTGIFISIITGAKPVSKEEWMLSNLMTAQSLHIIALHGGPRCCKRNTYLALTEAAAFLKQHFNIELGLNKSIDCEFKEYNKECLNDECKYYKDK